MTRRYLGIDGGGSNLRVVIVDEQLNTIGQALYPQTANPSSVGREAAASTIQSALRSALRKAQCKPDDIAAAGIGVAGASAEYAADWLTEVVSGVLPRTRVVPSSDIEIALVGAHGGRRGVIVLAGTGSVAYGVSESGDGLIVGGWGYVIGDEGSGFWLGLRAVQIAAREYDAAPDQPSELTRGVLEALEIPNGRALIRKIYGETRVDVRGIAALATLLLDAADSGDARAQDAVEQGAAALAGLVATLEHRLHLNAPPVALAGGLLQNANPLSRALCRQLALPEIPLPAHSPVVGAALLAQLTERT
jgi:N-acetylglucosamine kinase-like BadF-type ATPase